LHFSMTQFYFYQHNAKETSRMKGFLYPTAHPYTYERRSFSFFTQSQSHVSSLRLLPALLHMTHRKHFPTSIIIPNFKRLLYSVKNSTDSQ
jgi:hypothetical protein